jgi:hypothetical protein
MPSLYRQHRRDMAQGVTSAPEPTRPPVIMKSTTASDTLLSLAWGLVRAGEARDISEGIEKIHATHPSLYRTHQGE